MKKQKKQLKFKNHFDKFPPILREMVMEAMTYERKETHECFGITPLISAFTWWYNRCFCDRSFWEAVNEDAIHHKIWKL